MMQMMAMMLTEEHHSPEQKVIIQDEQIYAGENFMSDVHVYFCIDGRYKMLQIDYSKLRNNTDVSPGIDI